MIFPSHQYAVEQLDYLPLMNIIEIWRQIIWTFFGMLI